MIDAITGKLSGFLTDQVIEKRTDHSGNIVATGCC
jgi:hypothetical protein